MKMIKKSMILLVLLALNVVADPAVVAPKVEKIDEIKELSLEGTFSKMAAILESAFEARASVKDDQSLAESGTKLENLAREMLVIEAGVDMTQKPNNKQVKDLAVRFIRMNEKVEKQKEEVRKLKLSDEIMSARDTQFLQFLKTVEPMKQKTKILFPPEKLAYFVEQIKVEEAIEAKKNKGKAP